MDPKDNKPAAAKNKYPPVKKAAAKQAANKAAAKKPTHKITVKRNGFRRCGRAWSGETEIIEGELKISEIQCLEADPMFVVEAL